MAGSEALPLDPAAIDEIADRLTEAVAARVVDLIRREELLSRAGAAQQWLDAQEVARRLGVSREWVYEHADELGGARIGRGPRPRLRFPAPSLNHPADGSSSRAEQKEPDPVRRRSEGLIPIYEE
jgi:predicted DNA-binding transcriptional regulator AlpA